jgi:hypothetical protein
MALFLKNPFFIFGGGFSLAIFLWNFGLNFHKTHHSIGGVFSQSIIDFKTTALEPIKNNRKVIVAGGSNVAYGVDSTQIEKFFGIEAVNYGCMVGLGPEIILESLKPNLIHGDILIMCWEYETYLFDRRNQNLNYLSMIFGPQSKVRENFSFSDRIMLNLSFPAHLIRRSIFHAYNPWYDLSIYECGWDFDSSGNVRSNKISKIEEEELVRSPLKPLLDEIVISQDLDDIFSDFLVFSRKQNVEVLATWPNTFANPAYINNKTYLENLKKISDFWRKLDVPIVGKPEGAMLPAKYFHDSAYHLNAEGTKLRTENLIKELQPWVP